MKATSQPVLVLTPLRAAVPAEGGTLEVLIRVQAPDRPISEAAPQRQPLRLAVVIDRSGSMSGQPLEEALRCAEYIAQGLQSTDRVGVVLYDNQVKVPVPLSAGGDGAAIRQALAGVESGGNTALFDGWEAGAKLLEQRTDNSMSRVLLLSDGQANEGLCDPLGIQGRCADWAAKGVTTTTVGLGRDFNEDLMIGMARAGKGQHYYGQTAEDLHDSFDEELALLQALYLRQLRIKLLPASGVITEPLGLAQQTDGGLYTLPDLAWGAEAWMMVRLHLSPNPGADPLHPQALIAVTVEGQSASASSVDPAETRDLVQLHSTLALPVVPGTDLPGIAQDELVARRLKELQFAQETEKVRAMVAAGHIDAAKLRLQQLQRVMADHPWLADKLAALQHLVQRDAAMSLKEMRYSMSRNSNRLVAKSESAYLVSETDNSAMPSFLRRKASEGQGRKPPKQ